MSEVECPVCHRIEFEDGIRCGECHWPLRPVNLPVGEVPYGHELRVEISTGIVGTRQETWNYKGDEATARRRAKTRIGFKRVLAVNPMGEVKYIAAYGEGRL